MSMLTPHSRSRPLYLPGHLLHSITTLILVTFTSVLSIESVNKAHGADSSSVPNIVLILADDLGYSDLGCYGSEIATPHLDRLAEGGLQFSQFYNTARCWPTRAALLTGYYAQQVRRDTLPGIRSGGGGKRPAWAPLLPAMLRPLGYRSYHSGKWHLDGMPIECGFDRSYYLKDQGRFFNPKTHYEDDRKLPAVKPGTDYYATTAIADHAIRCLKQHAKQFSDRPFFHYLAFTSPHFPLHALPEDIARYREIYRKGWDAIRAERWRRIRAKPIGRALNLSAVERNVGPPYDFPRALKTLGSGEINRPVPWNQLTESQRDFQATKMAIHAAMIDRMDREIGRVLDQLRQMGSLDNTLILFVSDNGASAEIMVRDDGHDRSAKPGSAATYLCLGPGWSTVSNTPFRRHKTWVHEGGISTPLIVHWPQGLLARGESRGSVGHVIDIVPTILDVAGGRHPLKRNGKPVPPLPGKSLVRVFQSDKTIDRDELWWFHNGNRAIRTGDWKLVSAGAKGPWELFDLSTDRAESKNLASKHPDIARRLQQRWSQRLEEFRRLASEDLPAQKAPETKKSVKKLILPGESFLVDGRPSFIMLPPKEKRSQPQPWIFYAPTLPGLPDAIEKGMHERFLAAGIAVAGIDIGESYGNAKGRGQYTAFYRELTGKRGFAKRMCLLGRSRGGLMISSWAIGNVDKVSGIAGIYPVFDLRSYPGVAKAAPAYGLAPSGLQEKLAEHNPIQRISVLAKAGIPAFLIHGDADGVVPLEKNSAQFVRHYRANGAEKAVRLVVAKGQGHNYWTGFFRSQELIDFVIARARQGAR